MSNPPQVKNKLIQSPLNYIGGKYKLLLQILPLLPKDINVFVDLFCGGANVAININSKKIILNDKQSEIIKIYKFFKENSIDSILKNLDSIIKNFNLSNTAKFGYQQYKCNSANGLSSYNKKGFLQLRESYNKDKDVLKLFALIVFGFNNQIRFNSKNEFNLPCGKRDFNDRMREKLIKFCLNIQHKIVDFSNVDFRDFDISRLDSQSFIYIDPPYFLANATYNENKSWIKNDELDLLDFLKFLDSKNIRFALSNVIFHKNTEHKILQNWLDKNPQFNTYFLDFNYKNCNYQAKNSHSQEVLITNY